MDVRLRGTHSQRNWEHEVNTHRRRDQTYAIYTHLTFLHKVINCKGPSKEHFQLSHNHQQFSSTQMVKHLEVLAHNQLNEDINPEEAAKRENQAYWIY